MPHDQGDPLREFLAFLDPLMIPMPAKLVLDPPDGEEVLCIGVRGRPTSVFAAGQVITNDGWGGVGVAGERRALPPAA